MMLHLHAVVCRKQQVHVGLLEDEGIVVNQINDGIRVAIRRASQKKVESLARLRTVQEKAEILMS